MVELASAFSSQLFPLIVALLLQLVFGVLLFPGPSAFRVSCGLSGVFVGIVAVLAVVSCFGSSAFGSFVTPFLPVSIRATYDLSRRIESAIAY